MDLFTSRARQDIRETLALVPEFHNLPANEQIDFYRHAVSARRDQLARGPQAAEGSALDGTANTTRSTPANSISLSEVAATPAGSSTFGR